MENNFTTLIDNYFAAWNETDPGRRQQIIANTWAEDATYLDPLMRGEGHSGIDAMIAGVQQQFAGLEFRQTGTIDSHNNTARFSWHLGPKDAPPVAGGTDFATVRDGKLASVTGFLDFAPAQK
jgi:hypothetical protein